MTIRVAVVEDNPLVLQALSVALKERPDIEIVATATGKADFLQLMDETCPDVVILDLSTGSRTLDPVAAIATLRCTRPMVEVLALISHGDTILVRQLIQAGIRGCLLEDDAQLLSLDMIVHRIVRGERVYSQAVIEQYFDSTDITLTSQEQAILRLIVNGLSNGRIAQRLGLSVNTVRNNLSSIYTKLGIKQTAGLNCRVTAIHRARQLGLI